MMIGNKDGQGTVANFPAVFIHICNFDICNEIQIPKDENKSQLSRAIYEGIREDSDSKGGSRNSQNFQVLV